MKKYICLLCLLVAVCFGQTQGPVGLQTVQSDGPPFDFWTKLPFSGTDIMYYCYAKSSNERTILTPTSSATGATTTFTFSAGHGFSMLTNPTVIVSGATGTSVAVNGTFVATVVSSTVISIPVDTTALVSLAGTIKVSTNAPRTSRPVWTIQKIVSTADGPAALWSTNGRGATCDNRATESYQ